MVTAADLALRASWNTIQRYGLSMTGPALVSAAHFLVSLIVLRTLPPSAFGQFSFLLVVVPFCLSGVAALLGAPAAQVRGKSDEAAARDIRILVRVSVVVSLASFATVFVLMRLAHAAPLSALCFAAYGLLFSLRGFVRALANVRAQYRRVAASDASYAVTLIAVMTALVWTHSLEIESGAGAFALAALVCLVPFGAAHWRAYLSALRLGRLADYRPIWRDIARWSLAGVVLTEATINAHAYLVTFLVGPHAFGLLAVGALFMRPASLVMSALPEIDMPIINRLIADRDMAGAFKVVRTMRLVGFLALAATTLLALAIMTWFPELVLKKGYRADDVTIVLGLWTAIVGLRMCRTPEAVFLQAANRYRALARISTISGVVSLCATAGLLVAFGPIASLGGLALGELAIIVAIYPVVRGYRVQHA